MRPRTRSVVSTGEYFRQESAYATTASSSSRGMDPTMDSDERWLELAVRGGKPNQHQYQHQQLNHHTLVQYHQQQAQTQPLHPHHPYSSLMTKGGRKRNGSDSSFSSRSTLPSWDESDRDLEDLDDEDEDEDEEDDDGIERLRTCSHDRRISFDDDANVVVTIPSRESFDSDYKSRVWYSVDDFSRMRQQE